MSEEKIAPDHLANVRELLAKHKLVEDLVHRQDMPRQDLVEDVLRKVDHAEYKRREYPPGPKISGRAFGRDRRLPITNAWRETLPHDS